ncbi:MAG: hypothetical protein L0215_01375 [Gemmataceae bacterium]|nr:hypothetical protein [Gemmataceae bacterium]
MAKAPALVADQLKSPTAMKKRRLLWFVATSVLLFGAGYAALWLTAPRHRINALSFEQIREWMTEKEVEGILGVPAGDYTTAPVMVLDDGTASTIWISRVKRWTSNDTAIDVFFDDLGLVTRKRLLDVIPLEESIWQKLRRWLRIN